MAALDRAIAQDDSKKLRDAADKLLEKAAEGEPWAIGMLADRLDGKVAQDVTVAGDPNRPVHIYGELVDRIVDPKNGCNEKP